MNTFYLRFPDEAAFISACETAGFWITEEPERPLLLSHTHTFDVVGVITSPTVLDGWHVNAKLPELPAGWDAYVITPTTPMRVFAGD